MAIPDVLIFFYESAWIGLASAHIAGGFDSLGRNWNESLRGPSCIPRRRIGELVSTKDICSL